MSNILHISEEIGNKDVFDKETYISYETKFCLQEYKDLRDPSKNQDQTHLAIQKENFVLENSSVRR